MEKYRYIIIDDEQPSHLLVKNHFKKYPNYKCMAQFDNPEKALIYLDNNEIDLIFLDIEMPEMNGFQFLEALKKNIFVVILTAYPDKYGQNAHHYYIDSNLIFFSNKAQFSYYLPKIIARFEKMHEGKEKVDRINQLFKNNIQTFPKVINNQPIPYIEILAILIIGHNTALRMIDGQEHIFRMTIRELLDFLPPNQFLHINRNTIINMMHVTAFTRTTVCISNQYFDIAVRKRKDVIPKLMAQKQKLCHNYQ